MPRTAVRQDLARPAPRAGGAPWSGRPRTLAGRARAVGVLVTAAAGGAAGAASVAAAVPVLAAATAPATTAEDLLVALAAGAGGALVTTWAVAAALLALARLAPRADVPSALCGAASRLLPALLRAVLLLALGVGPASAAGPAPSAAPTAVTAPADLGAAPVAPSPAGPPTGTAPEAAAAARGVPDVTWRPSAPTRPTSGATDAAGSLVVPQPRGADGRQEHPGEVVVVRGDTLWDIARRRLPAGADDAEVAAAWPAWYAANRAVIGDDPDLLLPGQRLAPPATAAGTHP